MVICVCETGHKAPGGYERSVPTPSGETGACPMRLYSADDLRSSFVLRLQIALVVIRQPECGRQNLAGGLSQVGELCVLQA